MIESKTLGAAVGVQRGDVIDKTESTSLPSATNAIIVGKFRRGRMDKPFRVTRDNYQALLGFDPSNPSYNTVEDALKQGVASVMVGRVGSSLGKSEAGIDSGFSANENILLGYSYDGQYALDARDIILTTRINNGKLNTRRIPAELFEDDGIFKANEASMILMDLLNIPTEGLFYYMQGFRDGLFDDTPMQYRFAFSASSMIEPPFYSQTQMSSRGLVIQGFDKPGFDNHLNVFAEALGMGIPDDNKPIWNPEEYKIEILQTPIEDMPDNMTVDFLQILNEMGWVDSDSVVCQSEGWIDYRPLAPLLT